MTQEKSYSINKENNNRLIFMTSSFRADSGSVLHKGIYNNELASMLSSITISGIIYILLAFNYKIVLIHYLTMGIIFIITFIGFRKFVFKERYLKVVFDKSKKITRINRPWFITKKTEEIPFSNIGSIEVGSKRIVPENPDGIQFVQKISLQHGSAIPGLGDEIEFVTMLLKLTDGTERVIYAEKITNNKEPELPLKEIKSFLKD